MISTPGSNQLLFTSMNLTQAYCSVPGKESENKRAEARPRFTSMNFTQAYWSVAGKQSENKRAEFKHSWRDAIAMIYSMQKAILLRTRKGNSELEKMQLW